MGEWADYWEDDRSLHDQRVTLNGEQFDEDEFDIDPAPEWAFLLDIPERPSLASLLHGTEFDGMFRPNMRIVAET